MRFWAYGLEFHCKSVSEIEAEWALWFIFGMLVGPAVAAIGGWLGRRATSHLNGGMEKQPSRPAAGDEGAPAERKVPKDPSRPN